jgi:hypothetical protein
MTKAKTKLVLNDVQSIPLNKLVTSEANVRRIKNGISIEELAADIAHLPRPEVSWSQPGPAPRWALFYV